MTIETTLPLCYKIIQKAKFDLEDDIEIKIEAHAEHILDALFELSSFFSLRTHEFILRVLYQDAELSFKLGLMVFFLSASTDELTKLQATLLFITLIERFGYPCDSPHKVAFLPQDIQNAIHEKYHDLVMLTKDIIDSSGIKYVQINVN